jgi:hypothetical protein
VGERLRRFSEWLERTGRSPLYVVLLRGAAEDFHAGGVVARAFDGIAVPPGSVPALRLMAALHYLVLRGHAPELARFFPSAGGGEPADHAWPVAAMTLEGRLAQVRARLRRGVQTNEPGRSAALYGGLLWASERVQAPLRLLEIGASAGLNLLVDRFSYAVGGELLGEPSSPVRFQEPWRGAPVGDPSAAAERLLLIARAGCDPSPIDVRAAGARELLLSYVWPDEPERLERLQAALELARAQPPQLQRGAASVWLPGALAGGEAGVPVVFQSVMWQYLTDAERAAVTAAIERAGARGPLIWLTLEPGGDGSEPFELAARTWPGDERVLLARCGDHGPPVEWVGARLPAHGKGVSQLREGAGLRSQPQPLDGGDQAAL